MSSICLRGEYAELLLRGGMMVALRWPTYLARLNLRRVGFRLGIILRH